MPADLSCLGDAVAKAHYVGESLGELGADFTVFRCQDLVSVF
jgi:hypothetical protein